MHAQKIAALTYSEGGVFGSWYQKVTSGYWSMTSWRADGLNWLQIKQDWLQVPKKKKKKKNWEKHFIVYTTWHVEGTQVFIETKRAWLVKQFTVYRSLMADNYFQFDGSGDLYIFY